MNIRDEVRFVNMNKELDGFMFELGRLWHNASLLRFPFDIDWARLSDDAPLLIERVYSKLTPILSDYLYMDTDLHYYGRHGATLATDCYWTMRQGWTRDDVALEFDLPENASDTDYRPVSEALYIITGHHRIIKEINNVTMREVAAYAEKNIDN